MKTRPISFLFRYLLALIPIVIISLTIINCGGKAGSSSSSSDDSTPGDGNNPPIGKVDNNDFWVRLYDNAKFPFYTHTTTSFTDECKIPFATSLSSLSCLIEINELDLYDNKVQFQYNVPVGMCDYFRITPYYFYNQEVGYGPSAITMNVTYDNTGAVVTSSCVVDGVAGNCSIDNTVPEYTELNFDLTTAGVTCVYDRSGAGANNCCFGNYKLNQTITRTNPPSPDSVSTVSIDGKWGGSINLCYGGHVRTSGWTLSTKNGYVASSIQYVGGSEGLNNVLNLPALIDEPNSGENMTVANYYNTSGLHDHVDIATGTVTSHLPYAIDPIDDRSGTPLSATSDAWTFDCLDKAMEVKNRIKIYVREWDAYADYLTYISSKGITVNPDRTGTEDGISCTGISGNCNDLYDLDDIPNLFNSNGGSYDQTGVNKITKRRYFFPEINY